LLCRKTVFACVNLERMPESDKFASVSNAKVKFHTWLLLVLAAEATLENIGVRLGLGIDWGQGLTLFFRNYSFAVLMSLRCP